MVRWRVEFNRQVRWSETAGLGRAYYVQTIGTSVPRVIQRNDSTTCVIFELVHHVRYIRTARHERYVEANALTVLAEGPV